MTFYDLGIQTSPLTIAQDEKMFSDHLSFHKIDREIISGRYHECSQVWEEKKIYSLR